MDWTSLLPAGALAPPSDGLLALAAVLVLGALGGELIARLSRLPRVAGYTLAGWLVVLFGQPVAVPLAGGVRLVVDLALALVLFELGCQLRLRWLLRNPALLATSLLEAVLAAAAVYAALRAFGLGAELAASCAVLAMPASAAVAGSVADEWRADGQVTLRMKHLTALNTLYAVVAIVLLKGWLLANGARPDWLMAMRELVLALASALMLAALLAAAVALVASRLDLRQQGAMLLLLGLVLLALGLSRWLQASALLVPLLAGILLRNSTERPWVWPRHFGSAGGLLVLLLFVIVGASWSPALLAGGFAAGALLIAVRGLAKTAVVTLLSRWSHLSWRQGAALGVSLLPLSATPLVLVSELLRVEPQLGAQLLPVLLSAVFVVELLGPLAVQLALRWAGELPEGDSR